MRRQTVFLGILALLAVPVAGWAQTLYDTAPNAQTGTQVYGSYFGTDVDQAGLYNGNLSVRLSLFNLPGRELSAGRVLVYNNQHWDQRDCGGLPCGQYTGGWKVTGMFGSQPSFFAEYLSCSYNSATGIYQPLYAMNVYWINGSGAKRRYLLKLFGTTSDGSGQCPDAQPPGWDNLTLPSADSDGSTFYTAWFMSTGNDARITFKDGTSYYFHASALSGADYLTTLNGNYLTRTGTTDTLGRTIQPWTELDDFPVGDPHTKSYTVTDATNTVRTYTVYYQGRSIPDPYQVNTPVYVCCFIDSITLPNSKTYTFTYNTTGYLEKLTFPTGAYVRYVYGTYGYPDPNSDAVIERRVSEDGTTGGEKVWTYTRVNDGSTRTVTVKSPENDQVVHTFNAQGEETATTWWSSPASYLHRGVTSSWSQSGIEANGQPNNPRISTVTTSLDVNSPALQSTKTLVYDSDGYLIQDKVTEWATGGGGPIVLQKDLSYTTIGPANVKKNRLGSREGDRPGNWHFRGSGPHHVRL